MSNSHTGGCVCGAVEFDVTLKNKDAHACHCSMCRKWGAGPFIGLDCAAPPTFKDASAVGRYSSSDWGERVFCTKCGSSLVWRTKDNAHISVSAGALDVRDGVRLALEFFIDEKPEFYELADDSKKLTGQQVFEMFAPKET